MTKLTSEKYIRIATHYRQAYSFKTTPKSPFETAEYRPINCNPLKLVTAYHVHADRSTNEKKAGYPETRYVPPPPSLPPPTPIMMQGSYPINGMSGGYAYGTSPAPVYPARQMSYSPTPQMTGQVPFQSPVFVQGQQDPYQTQVPLQQQFSQFAPTTPQTPFFGHQATLMAPASPTYAASPVQVQSPLPLSPNDFQQRQNSMFYPQQGGPYQPGGNQ